VGFTASLAGFSSGVFGVDASLTYPSF